MTKKLVFILAVALLLFIIRNYFSQQVDYSQRVVHSDSLAVGSVRIVDGGGFELYKKTDVHGAVAANVATNDTIVIAGIIKNWCKIGFKGMYGYRYSYEIESGSELAGTPKWRIWMKHNYRVDRWMFWILSILLLVALYAVLPAFAFVEGRVLGKEDERSIRYPSGTVQRFLFQLFVPDFQTLYIISIATGALMMFVALFFNSAFTTFSQFGLLYLLHDSHTISSVLFTVLSFAAVAGIVEVAGSFLYFNGYQSAMRSLCLLIAATIALVLSIAVFLPVMLILAGAFILKIIAGSGSGSGGTSTSSSTTKKTSVDDYFFSSCPACNGSGRTGRPGSVFPGCGLCASTGRVKHKR
jgi:MFS family permease